MGSGLFSVSRASDRPASPRNTLAPRSAAMIARMDIRVWRLAVTWTGDPRRITPPRRTYGKNGPIHVETRAPRRVRAS